MKINTSVQLSCVMLGCGLSLDISTAQQLQVRGEMIIFVFDMNCLFKAKRTDVFLHNILSRAALKK